MASFNAGQVVELQVWSDYGVDTVFRTGDRGTVAGPSIRWGRCAVRDLWHRLGRETDVLVNRLRIYTHPADAPGRSHGSFSTMQALQIVLREEQPHVITEVQRDLKRARTEVEDLRGSEAKSSHGISKIQHALSVASNEALVPIRDPLADHRAALNAAHVALQSADWDLGS